MDNIDTEFPVYPDENQTNFLRLLGYLFLCSEKYNKATTVFELLSIYYPEDIDIATSLAFSLYNEKQYEKSFALSTEIIKNNADKEKIKRTKIIQAKSLWGLDKKEEAAQTLKKLVLYENNG